MMLNSGPGPVEHRQSKMGQAPKRRLKLIFPQCMALDRLPFLLLALSLPLGASSASLGHVKPTEESSQKKTVPTPGLEDGPKHLHDAPVQQDWIHMNLALTPPSSSFYSDEGFYIDVPDERLSGQRGEAGAEGGDDRIRDHSVTRDQYTGVRQSTFLISLIAVVSVVAGCGATIVIFGYYCQLCC